jgi:hypothetical protein
MINGKKIVVVLPAYNAALTLKRTYDEIPFDIVDDDMESVLEAALGFIKHMGTGRNRGLGRCKFSIEKGGKA